MVIHLACFYGLEVTVSIIGFTMETGCSPVFVFLGEIMAKRFAKRRTTDHPAAVSRRSDADILKRQRVFVETVMQLAEPLCAAEGMELVHVEYQRESGGLTLRVYLDKPGGVTLDDCVDISRQLDAILDVHAQDGPPYRLEVSSPGIDRPIGKLSDFNRFKGQRARISLLKAVNGRKKFTGTLDGVVGDAVHIVVDEERFSIDFKDILKARLVNYNGER